MACSDTHRRSLSPHNKLLTRRGRRRLNRGVLLSGVVALCLLARLGSRRVARVSSKPLGGTEGDGRDGPLASLRERCARNRLRHHRWRQPRRGCASDAFLPGSVSLTQSWLKRTVVLPRVSGMRFTSCQAAAAHRRAPRSFFSTAPSGVSKPTAPKPRWAAPTSLAIEYLSARSAALKQPSAFVAGREIVVRACRWRFRPERTAGRDALQPPRSPARSMSNLSCAPPNKALQLTSHSAFQPTVVMSGVGTWALRSSRGGAVARS